MCIDVGSGTKNRAGLRVGVYVMRSAFVFMAALLLALPASAQIGSNPRMIEVLQIGGGYDDATDGGADTCRS